jgi:hypothetical protein
MEDRTKMLERIQGLINKAEQTEFEEEAKVFMEKAQELLSKYSLSEYDLKSVNALGEKDVTVTVAIRCNDPHLTAKCVLISSVATANNCRVVKGNMQQERGDKAEFGKRIDYWTKEPARVISVDNMSRKYRNMYITGFSRDIDAVTLLYTSFLIQIANNVRKAEVPSYVSKGTWTAHFIEGFGREVGRRLREANRKSRNDIVTEFKEEGVDLLPVLVEREAEVNAAYEQTWQGNLGKGRASGHKSSTGGQFAGRQAGASADIGNKRIGGIGQLGRG